MTLNQLVPTYGSWGGPGWSAGERTQDGKPINWSIPGDNDLDTLFKAHDLAYYNAENEPNPVKAAKIIFYADVALLRDIQALENSNIGLYGELYQPLAMIAFGDKSLWDLAQIALAQLEQLGANNGQYDPFPDNHTTIPSDINGLFNSAQGWMPPRRGDPLVLDIDGDGIETIQINTNSPILFDHDGDGIKTATGWVKSDDALLVFDRNANGTIDNGSELFGDQTIVNGVKATDGFAALSAEDTNADGVFDANDTNFNNVRLWQDLNQNGISETNELKTLTQAGIVSISLSSTQTNTVVNGGIQTAEGTFTKADGTTGESATVDVGSLGNYIFDSNSFYREFTDTIPLTEAASALPEVQGSGVVRDLREAASMQTTEGAALT
ncbi:MAG: hypothetical protein Q7U00_00525, partial [Sulfurimonas sp.]|nr:hypothetical protein [Sulfurimonas sp.]